MDKADLMRLFDLLRQFCKEQAARGREVNTGDIFRAIGRSLDECSGKVVRGPWLR